MSLLVEKYAEWILAFIATTAYFLWFRNCVICTATDESKSIFSVAINVSAIAVGFLITVKSILFSIENKKSIRQLKDAGYFSKFIGYIVTAIYWSFFMAILSAILLFVDFSIKTSLNETILGAWIFVIIGSVTSCYRVIHIFTKILTRED